MINVLANDLADLAITTDSMNNAAHGATALLPAGTVRFTPVADYFRPDRDLSLASPASLESFKTLLLPLMMLDVTVVWFISGSRFPLLFFWAKKGQQEEAARQEQRF